MQENPISLEQEVRRFLDFLNSDDFVTNPDLQTLNIQLVELYLSALKYGIENKKANRQIVDWLTHFFRESKLKKQSKLVKFHETRKVPEPVLTALSQISFDYYCSHPEHETDITSPIYRHLLGDMKEILCDLNSVLAFQEVYPGQILMLMQCLIKFTKLLFHIGELTTV